MKAKKTFKLGELCTGGIIEVNIKNKDVSIDVIDWDTNVQISNYILSDEDLILNYLLTLTTYYHAEKIMEWIKTKVKFNKAFDMWS